MTACEKINWCQEPSIQRTVAISPISHVYGVTITGRVDTFIKYSKGIPCYNSFILMHASGHGTEKNKTEKCACRQDEKGQEPDSG